MKKSLKMAVSFLLMLSMLLAFAGCGEEKQAQKAFEHLMTALKSLDFEQAKQYTDLDELTVGAGESLTGEAKYFAENLFDKLEWRVVSAKKVDDKTVQITANITAADMKPILGAFFQKAMEYAFGNAFSSAPPSEEETEAEMSRILKEVIDGATLETVTNEVTVKVVKGENGWRVVSDDAFADALFGGMQAAVSELENSFSME